MSGFSPQWLALREGADTAARNAQLRGRVAAMFAPRASLRVVDLGCGAGANLRALAPAFPVEQSWRLIDHDRALLGAAKSALAAWADDVEERNETLILRRDGKYIEVAFECADLFRDIEAVLTPPADLVATAAFLDLTSAAWLERLASRLVKTHAPFLAVLTYDGREIWTPPQASDDAMLAAFHVHQSRDKGFGPAAGPSAATILSKAFRHSRWRVETTPSDWVLGPADAALIAALAEGAANAIGETGLVAPAIVADWRAARRVAKGCVIGHVDLLATP